jgi:phosphonate transport system substrate-binding protein
MVRITKSLQLLAAIWALLGASPQDANQTINIGLAPDGMTQGERAPLREYLTKAMGRPVNLMVPDRYSDAAARLADGSYDFACLGGLTYVKAHAANGVIPLVQRTSDRKHHSVFITGTNSPIRSLRDLKGRQFAFGDIYSTSGHLIPDRELRQAGVNPETDLLFRYSGSHPVTAALVEAGVVEAGALDETIFRSMVAGRKIDGKKVRIFYTSEPFVDWLYVARRNLPLAEQEKFARALLALKEGETDAVLKVLGARQFVRANDEEYAGIRRMATELGLF